jgi:hypothetical protein
MRFREVLLAAVLLVPAVSAAEPGNVVSPEVRPVVGAFVPTGDLRDVLKDAVVVGVQGGMELAAPLHLLGMFAWSPSKNQLLATDDGVNLYQYDAGLELFNSMSMGESWMARPFLGIGVGGRTFDFKMADLDTKTYFTGYGALGAEFQMEKVALRIEGRDYLYQSDKIGNEGKKTRNDLMLMTGIAYHLW